MEATDAIIMEYLELFLRYIVIALGWWAIEIPKLIWHFIVDLTESKIIAFIVLLYYYIAPWALIDYWRKRGLNPEQLAQLEKDESEEDYKFAMLWAQIGIRDRLDKIANKGKEGV